jgi:hypothetical protein
LFGGHVLQLHLLADFWSCLVLILGHNYFDHLGKFHHQFSTLVKSDSLRGEPCCLANVLCCCFGSCLVFNLFFFKPACCLVNHGQTPQLQCWILQGSIRSTHGVSHGFSLACLAGSLPHFWLATFDSLQSWHFLQKWRLPLCTDLSSRNAGV